MPIISKILLSHFTLGLTSKNSQEYVRGTLLMNKRGRTRQWHISTQTLKA